MEQEPAVYIMASQDRCLYIGVTRSLRSRWEQHMNGTERSFTRRYNITRLVYFEMAQTMVEAISREKQLKRWRRAKKIALIEARNPGWVDLALAMKWSEGRGAVEGHGIPRLRSG